MIIVLAVVAIVAPLLTAGATALYFTNHEQDVTISELRSQIEELRTANDRLFGELASTTAAGRRAAREVSRLKGQLASTSAELQRTRSALAAAKRALRDQARAFRAARERARTSAHDGSGVDPARGMARLVYRAVAHLRSARFLARSTGTPAAAAARAGPSPAPQEAAPPRSPPASVAKKGSEGGRGRGWDSGSR
jgi:hypothetical protein